MSASPGPGGGGRGLRHLRELLAGVGMSLISSQASIPRANAAFNADGNMVRNEDLKQIEQVVAELLSALSRAEPAVA